MEKPPDLSPTKCLNCGTIVSGAYCHNCGQRVRDNTDRSLSRLLGEFLGNVFFLDNRFFLSIWYLVRFPSRMTVEYLDGRRKKFISPVTLFLFINLIYFLVSPLSDYSLALEDQIYSQPYSKWIEDWATQKIQEDGRNWNEYSVAYQQSSDNVSKSVMIINIPNIACFVYLVGFKRRKYYFDSLIFAFHFFSFFMLSWVMNDWMGSLIDFVFGHETSMISSISLNLFVFIIPLVYAMLGISKFLRLRWYWSIPAGLGVMMGVLVTNLLYRLIILVLTIWTT